MTGDIAATEARVVDWLVEHGRLDTAGCERARRVQEGRGGRLSAILTALGIVAERDVAEATATILGLPLVGAESFPQAPVLEEHIQGLLLIVVRPIRDAREVYDDITSITNSLLRHPIGYRCKTLPS